MMPAHDSRLEMLERQLDEFMRGQEASYRKMDELRVDFENDTQRLKRDYEYEVEKLRRNYDAAGRQIEDVRRQIDRRKHELEQEAARANHKH